MKPEQAIAAFVYNTTFKDLPAEQVAVAKKQILTIFGAAVAGSASEGCETVAEMAKEQGGKPESTLLVFGGKVPAKEAAFVNATMGRALDICDHIQPGLHAGSAVIPTALAVAEMMGGCTGEELITAVAIGTEIPLRINRTMQVIEYDGFDPTGVVGVFGAAAAAAKLMKLDEKQILNALGLAFNRSGATYQNNIDGCLGVRIMEGWVAQAGIECAKLAARGITGPKNFLDGVYGFCHLFGRDREGVTGARIVEDLGKVWHLTTLNFKKYPSCGLTQGSTELILMMMEKYGLVPEEIAHIDADVPPGTYNLVGKAFEIGDNPKVDAQFSLAYTFANALYRKTSSCPV
jgi:2-methylcitrate dehydratase PrpD